MKLKKPIFTEDEAATQPQIDYMKKLEIYDEKRNYTKSEAMLLIKIAKEKQK